VFPTIAGKSSSAIWAKVALKFPLNGAVTELFTGEMSAVAGGAPPAGSITLTTAEPLSAGGHAAVEYMRPLADVAPVGGVITSCVPTVAPAWVVPNTNTDAANAATAHAKIVLNISSPPDRSEDSATLTPRSAQPQRPLPRNPGR
jgi:hypothetical protein